MMSLLAQLLSGQKSRKAGQHQLGFIWHWRDMQDAGCMPYMVTHKWTGWFREVELGILATWVSN